MRTNEEMLRAVHERASQMRHAQRKRRAFLAGGAAVGCALIMTMLLAGAMPTFQRRRLPGNESVMQASMLTDSGALGYAVVGIVAFLLGAAATVFCVLFREWRDREEKRDDRER